MFVRMCSVYVLCNVFIYVYVHIFMFSQYACINGCNVYIYTYSWM